MGQIARSGDGFEKDSRIRSISTANSARELSGFAIVRPTSGQSDKRCRFMSVRFLLCHEGLIENVGLAGHMRLCSP
jgi:hypothetical protein